MAERKQSDDPIRKGVIELIEELGAICVEEQLSEALPTSGRASPSRVPSVKVSVTALAKRVLLFFPPETKTDMRIC